MEQQTVQQLITQYLDLIRRGKYFIIVPLAICVFLGTALAFKLPKVYRSETKMFYMQTQLPDWAKLEVMNMYLEAMLIFIEAMALSPENSIKLINELELYPEQAGKVATSDLIDNFKNHYSLTYDYTEVPTTTGRSQEIITGFTFSFDHADPRKAYYVANALATSFIEMFRRFREASSSQGESFFEAERERLRREMSFIDQQISNFKQKHVNELPELFQFNYSALERLNQKIFMIDQQLMERRDRKESLETQLIALDPVLGMTGISGERIVSPQERLAALTAELGQLRARYSERHPDVRRTQMEIAELNKLVNKNGGQNVQSDGRGWKREQKEIDNAVIEQTGGAFNPAYRQFLMQLDEVKSEIASLQAVRAETAEEVEEYERRVGMTPLVEKEWLILARDRESAEKRFNDLASQVQTMQSSAEMEKRELGGRLSIGQPPVVPVAPYKPNIPMIIGASMFLGLSIGIGLLLGWDYMYKTVRGPQDLAISGLALVVDLPMVVSADAVTRVRFNKVFVRVAVFVLLVGVIVAVDLFYMKIDVLIVKIFSLIQAKLVLTGL
jgi:succinoglycan biosynthesis transport protein ExoP